MISREKFTGRPRLTTRQRHVLRMLVDSGSLTVSYCSMITRLNFTLSTLERKGLVTLEGGKWRPTEEAETL